MKMTAAVLRRTDAPRPFAESRPISIEEVELDPPGPGELLVRIAGGGLCHSDLSVMNGARPQPMPLVLGHEGAGEVVEIGPAIREAHRENFENGRSALIDVHTQQELNFSIYS